MKYIIQYQKKIRDLREVALLLHSNSEHRDSGNEKSQGFQNTFALFTDLQNVQLNLKQIQNYITDEFEVTDENFSVK